MLRGSTYSAADDKLMDIKAFLRKRCLEIADSFTEGEININFPIREYIPGEMIGVDSMVNQAIIIYKNGRFEVLPVGVLGTQANEYLGYKLRQIAYWGILPSVYSNEHPIQPQSGRNIEITNRRTEVYEEYKKIKTKKINKQNEQ